jgi:hypothetical protein
MQFFEFISLCLRFFQRAVIFLVMGALLVSCLGLDSDLREISRNVKKLCEVDGGQIINGQISGGGLSMFTSINLSAKYEINSVTDPRLSTILNSDGVTLKKSKILEFASADINFGSPGELLIGNKIDYYDQYINPRGRYSEDRVVPIDGPVGVYRFRLTNLEDERCAIFKQRLARIRPEILERHPDPSIFPSTAVIIELNKRGQCFYQEYLGPLEDYEFAKYISYGYTIFDRDLSVGKIVDIILDTSTDSIVVSQISYTYSRMYNWGMWTAGCWRQKFPQPNQLKAVGIIKSD